MQRVARFCQRHALLPSHLLCSPLVRALETAQGLRENLANCPKAVIVPWLAHGADTQTALQADLRIYTGMLGEMAGVEDDLVLLEQVGSEN